MFEAIRNSLVSFLAGPASEGEVSATSREQAWSDDLNIYGWKDFPKYNPDKLITRKGYGIYREMMIDEQVKAVVRFKRDAITSRDYMFVCDDEITESLSDADLKLRKDLFQTVINRYTGSFIDALNGIMSSMYQGFSVTEKIHQLIEYQDKQWVGIHKLKIKPYDTFFFYTDEYGTVERFEQQIGAQVNKLDMGKFIVQVNNPEIDEQYGRSELREAYRAWFSKDIILKYQNIFLGRYASGFIWAQPQENRTLDPNSEAYRTLKNVLSNIQTTTSMIAPNGVDINVVSPATTDAYERAVAQQDKAIAKALLVPNLLGITEQGNVGSYSQSETQLEAFFWTLDADATRLEEVLNEQLFKELGDLNFGDDLYPKFKFKPVSLTMKLKIAKAWRELVSGNAATATDTDEDYLRDLLGFPPPGEPKAGAAPPTAKPVTAPTPGEGDLDEEEDDETLIGTPTTIAYSRAERRVDFAGIDRSVEVGVYQRGDTLGDVVAQGVEATLSAMGEGDTSLSDVAKTSLPASTNKAIKKIINETLKEGWNTGQHHAEIEIKRAESVAKQEFSKKINLEALGSDAAKYFDAQSFIIAGDVSDKVTSIIKQAIMVGIRYSKSVAEVKADIYAKLSSAGLISPAAAEAALGELLNVPNPDHLLKTIIRTSTFEAVNESRFSYFTDPALNGFVEALQYSSILDSRTTAICNELGGSDGNPYVKSTAWPGWDKYRPPNHYNCRSLTIPITRVDEYEVTGSEPENEPLEGFA